MSLFGSNTDPAVVVSNKPKWLLPAGSSPRKFPKGQNAANTIGVCKADVAASVANTGNRGWSQGWVTVQRGTGPVVGVNVVQLTPGNYTVNNNVSVAFGSTANGSGANGIANFVSGNLVSITVDKGGSFYNTAPTVTISGGNGNSAAYVLTAVMGGRCGRINKEILVSMKGDMKGDDIANTRPFTG